MCGREYISVSRFKRHTFKFLKPDEKLHLKLFSASIGLMRGATEDRTAHLAEKEKWKPKAASAFDLMRCWEAQAADETRLQCQGGEQRGPALTRMPSRRGRRLNTARQECVSQPFGPILHLTPHFNMSFYSHIHTPCAKMRRSLVWLTRPRLSNALVVKANRGCQACKAWHRGVNKTRCVHTLPRSYISFLSVSSSC